MTTNRQPPTTNRAIGAWLTLCALLVVGMVAVGGYTRLSGSGLSITEWKPIHGAIPPIGEAEWEEEFARYRQIPQYAAINPDMTLEGFKQIFWPEYLHRLLGRIIGLVFGLPLVYFWARGQITRRQGLRLLAIFSLGGLQGAMGWYMVSSGLIENVYVSHLRLAAHLGLALLLLGLLIWEAIGIRQQALGIREESLSNPQCLMPNAYTLWFLLLALQIFYGALMAGLHAGMLHNTWPTMDGQMIPEGMWAMEPWWLNLIENRSTVQFWHRILAFWVFFGFAGWWFFNHLHVKSRKLAKLATAIAAVIALQFMLGVLTLLHAVPLALGLAHQLTAVLLFVLAVVMLKKVHT